ncbi:MAG TPA: ABC transporter permease subunit, partial [Chthonomonadales bacterium]|nr:ABC transporter permease subunit [Chthonomonadales bacterium]
MSSGFHSPSAASPIADLSYRGYDGPIKTRAIRFWIVSLATLRLIRKKPLFWILAAFAALPALLIAIQFYSLSMAQQSAGLAGPQAQSVSEFAQAADWQQLWLFFIALLAGAGTIAADNRTNALLVYLSKPLSKGDYLMGKWAGIAALLFAAGVVPLLVLYIFAALLYAGAGFVSHEPWLAMKIVCAAAVPAVVLSSVVLAVSAWCKSPIMA